MSNYYGNNGTPNFSGTNHQNSQMQYGNQPYVQENMYQQGNGNDQMYNNQQMMNQQQMYMNQQMMQQQQMMNQMMQQQQQLMKSNQELAKKNQQLQVANGANYSGGEIKPIRIRNKMSIIAGVVSLLTFFVGNFISATEWREGYTLSEYSDLIKDWYPNLEGLEKILCWFSSLLPIFLAFLIIVSFIGGFIAVNGFREWAIGLTIASTVSTFLYLFDDGVGKAFSMISTAWIFLIGGIIVAHISIDTDISLPKEVPTRKLGDGVSDCKLDLSSISSTKVGEWRCPKCDTKNTGSSCKTCGTSRP